MIPILCLSIKDHGRKQVQTRSDNIIGAICVIFGIIHLLRGIIILTDVEIEGLEIADSTYMGIISIESTVVHLVIATGLPKG